MTCDSHQSAGERTRWPRNGARLQAAQFRGTGLPQPRDRESGDQTFLPPHGPPVRARFIRCAVACCVKRQMHRRPKAQAVRRRRCGTPHRRVSALSTGAGAEAGTKTTPDGEPGNLTATVIGSTNEDSGAAAARSARRRRKRQTYLSNATEPTSSICSSMVKRQMPMWPLRKSPFASQSMLPETPW